MKRLIDRTQHCYWEYSQEDCTLVLSGCGTLPDLLVASEQEDQSESRVFLDVPWREHIGEIEQIVFSGDIPIIPNGAFWNTPQLKKVVAPNVSLIGNGAFYLCKNLKDIEIEELVAICEASFDGCSSLRTLKKPKGRLNFKADKLRFIGRSAFSNCCSIADISLDYAESIGDYAFFNCKNLKTVRLKNASQIGRAAFFGCEQLVSIELREGATIGEKAFERASGVSLTYLLTE
ncbi:MAG: leucine-rich repeat domain-containing protein [Kiritimatiellae bacterium]|nr:leucine-rich repeat domain-containing protein [Kiritimatiellia bacterium]